MPTSAQGPGLMRRCVVRLLGQRSLARSGQVRHGTLPPLAYIAGHFGLATEGLIEASPTGTGLEALCFQALGLGLKSRVVRLEAGSLSRLQLPCLVQHEHLGWMPLVAVHDELVTLQHPQQGRLHLQRDAWAMEFKGLALEFRRGS